MQPKLGQKVYFIYGTQIIKDTVGYLGKDSFVVNSIHDTCTERDSLIWDFEDYDVEWFTNLNKAKAALKNRFDDYEGRLTFTKIFENVYDLNFG